MPYCLYPPRAGPSAPGASPDISAFSLESFIHLITGLLLGQAHAGRWSSVQSITLRRDYCAGPASKRQARVALGFSDGEVRETGLPSLYVPVEWLALLS